MNSPNVLQTESAEFAMGFSTNDYGLITNPGKFEGEPWYTPYYWNMSMHGIADIYYHNEVDRYDLLKADTWESEMFTDIDNGDIVAISEDSQGFVYGEINPQF